jgi:hypothetical protein
MRIIPEESPKDVSILNRCCFHKCAHLLNHASPASAFRLNRHKGDVQNPSDPPQHNNDEQICREPEVE